MKQPPNAPPLKKNAKLCTGCDNPSKDKGEPAAKEKVIVDSSIIGSKCDHSRKFPTPVYAQRVCGGKILETDDKRGFQWDHITQIMQLWGCPDCLETWWQPLPFLLGDGVMWDGNADPYKWSQALFNDYLSTGKPGGLRHEMHTKRLARWEKQKREAKRKKKA